MFYSNIYALPPILSGIVTFFLGSFVLFRGYKSSLNRSFALVCGSATLWLIGFGVLYSCNDVKFSEKVIKFLYSGVIFIPATFHHFTSRLVAPNVTSKSVKINYGITFIFELMLLTTNHQFIGIQHFFWGYQTKAGPINIYFLLYFHTIFIWCLTRLFRRMTDPNLPANLLNQTKCVFWSFSIALLGSSDWLSVYGFSFYPLGPFFCMFFTATSSIAILKYQLMDIRIVITRAVIYSAWLLLITVPYIGLVFFTHGVVSGKIIFFKLWSFFAISSLICGTLALLLAIFSLVHARSKSQKLFGLFNIAVSLWGYGCFYAGISKDNPDAALGWIIAVLGGYFISALFYHLVVCVCNLRNRLLILLLSYFQAAVFLLITLFQPRFLYIQTRYLYNYIAIEASPILISAIAIFYITVLFGFFELIVAHKFLDGQTKKIAGYLLAGFFVGFLGGASVTPSFFGREIIYPFGNVGICIYTLIIAYAIFKHNLLDIRVAVKKSAIYTALIAVISVSYLGIIYILHNYLFFNKESRFLTMQSFIGLSLIAIFFKPFEIYANRLIERHFFHGTIGQISEHVEKLQTEIERSERLKSVGILAAGMAHEIKNPLAAIKTFNEYLPTKASDPIFLTKFSTVVSSEVNKIDSIVKQLLEFSKPTPPIFEQVNLNQIIDDTLHLLDADFVKRQIEVMKCFTDEVSWISGDKQRLQQAFLNLFLNSIHAMPQAGKLSLSIASSSKNSTLLTITDTGHGIPKDNLTHIFDPFFTTKEDGTGLGLAITHGILKEHGCKIAVTSRENFGTLFEITFPRLIPI